MKSSIALFAFFVLILSSYLMLENPPRPEEDCKEISTESDAHSLTLRRVADGKVESMLPENFEVLPLELFRIKYPLAKPDEMEVWSDATLGVNMGFELTKFEAGPESMKDIETLFCQQFEENPYIEVIQSRLVSQQGREWIQIEMVTPASDEPIYNLMMLTHMEGRLLVCTFNAAESMVPEWKATGKRMMQFLAVVD